MVETVGGVEVPEGEEHGKISVEVCHECAVEGLEGEVSSLEGYLGAVM